MFVSVFLCFVLSFFYQFSVISIIVVIIIIIIIINIIIYFLKGKGIILCFKLKLVAGGR